MTKLQFGLIIKVQKIKKTTKTKEKERKNDERGNRKKDRRIEGRGWKQYIFQKEASKFVSIQTLKKYDLIETVKEVNREEVSIEELVAEVNSMLGQDCYGYNPGEYIYENGKVYLETTSYGYKFK